LKKNKTKNLGNWELKLRMKNFLPKNWGLRSFLRKKPLTLIGDVSRSPDLKRYSNTK